MRKQWMLALAGLVVLLPTASQAKCVRPIVLLPTTSQWKCVSPTRTEEVHGTLKSGLRVTLHSPDTAVSPSIGRRNSLRALLRNDRSQHWRYWYSVDEQNDIENGDDAVMLLVKLKDPVIVTAVTLHLCGGPAVADSIRPKQVYIERDQSSVPGFPDGTFHPLAKGEEKQVIKLPVYSKYDWSNLFPTRRILIHVTDVYGKKKSGIGCFSGIGLSYKTPKATTYKPADSWAVLRRRILAHLIEDRHGQWDSSTMNNDRYSYEFMYYVVTGNADARKMFNTYDPMDVGLSEVLDVWRGAVKELSQR